MDLSDIRHLYAFDKWANARLMELVEKLSPEEYSKDLGSSFGGIHGTLVHIYGADWIWLERWHGNSPTSLPVEIPDLTQLKQHWSELQAKIDAYISGLTENQLHSGVSYKDLRGNAYTQPLWQLLQHKVNHSTYHRGQIVTFLRQLGATAVSTDLVAYYRQVQQAAKAG